MRRLSTPSSASTGAGDEALTLFSRMVRYVADNAQRCSRRPWLVSCSALRGRHHRQGWYGIGHLPAHVLGVQFRYGVSGIISNCGVGLTAAWVLTAVSWCTYPAVYLFPMLDLYCVADFIAKGGMGLGTYPFTYLASLSDMACQASSLSVVWAWLCTYPAFYLNLWCTLATRSEHPCSFFVHSSPHGEPA